MVSRNLSARSRYSLVPNSLMALSDLEDLSDPGSPVVPQTGSISTTPTSGKSDDHPRQLFHGRKPPRNSAKEAERVLMNISNARARGSESDPDTQMLILKELKKTNCRLDEMASDFF